MVGTSQEFRTWGPRMLNVLQHRGLVTRGSLSWVCVISIYQVNLKCAFQNTSCLCRVVQLCPTLCDPMDCSLPGSSVHEISQARILEWVAIPFSRGIFPIQGSNEPLSPATPALAGGFFITNHLESPTKDCSTQNASKGPPPHPLERALPY